MMLRRRLQFVLLFMLRRVVVGWVRFFYGDRGCRIVRGGGLGESTFSCVDISAAGCCSRLRMRFASTRCRVRAPTQRDSRC